MLKASVAASVLSQLNTDGVLATLYVFQNILLLLRCALLDCCCCCCSTRLLDGKGDILVAACPPEAMEQQKAIAAIFGNIWTEYSRAANAALGSSSTDEELSMVLLDLEVRFIRHCEVPLVRRRDCCTMLICYDIYNPQGAKVAMSGLCDGRFILCVHANVDVHLGMLRTKVCHVDVAAWICVDF